MPPPPGSPLILGPYPPDELAEGEVDQAMLQEGSSPAQVIGAVARHVRQAPGRQMGRQAGACGPGLGGWGVGGKRLTAQGQRPRCQTGTRASNIHEGCGPGGSTSRTGLGEAEPAASCWEWGGLGGDAHF